MATDCTVAATLPTITAALAETSSSTAAVTGGLPSLVVHLSSGMPPSPPPLGGTAVVRALAGTATAT